MPARQPHGTPSPLGWPSSIPWLWEETRQAHCPTVWTATIPPTGSVALQDARALRGGVSAPFAKLWCRGMPGPHPQAQHSTRTMVPGTH